MRHSLCLLAAFLTIATIGTASAQPRDILVFAAASLKNALDDIAAAYRRDTGTGAVASYAASSALARQIEAGAPADIFISADSEWMDYVEQRRLIRTATRGDLLGNRLVLIAPSSSRVDLAIGPGFGLAAALGRERLAMADPDYVPAGKYSRAALERFGVWDSVAARVARAENVRVALLLVARGEAPLGIVYRTDAAAESQVRVVGLFPENAHPAIVYPIALVADSVHSGAARFAAHLRAPAARPMWTKHGFTVID